MVIECVKKGSDPKNDQFGGHCNNCKSEYTALRMDLTVKKDFHMNETTESAKFKCDQCENGTVTFYKI